MTIDWRPINNLVGNLNGASMARVTPPGFFSRVEDFSNSYHNLISEYFLEKEAAERVLGKGLSNDVINDKLRKSGLRIHGSSHSSDGRDSFDTYDLPPMLRHFINDTCRLLEPLSPVLASKFGINVQTGRDGAGAAKYKSFDGTLKDLIGQGATPGLSDVDFFLDLYEQLWNEYKHVQSAGIVTTAWIGMGGSITEPTICGDRIKSYPNPRFRNVAIHKVATEVLSNLSDVVAVLE